MDRKLWWRLFVSVVLRYRGEALGLRAGNLTFITITSLVPLVTVVFSLLHTFIAKSIDPLVLKFFEDILSPGGRAQSAQTIRTFLSAANSGAARGLSFVVVLVSAGLMLRHVDASLNDIWRVRQKRPWMVSLSLYAGVLFVGPILIGLSLLGTAGVKSFLAWLDFPFSAQVYVVGSMAGAVGVLTLLYKAAPHGPVQWKSAIAGGAVAGIAWEIARHLYAGIAGLFFSANKVYGSLGIAPLFLMWIYVGWYIVLAGGRLAFAVEHAEFHNEFKDLQEHPRTNELVGARIVEEISRAYLLGTTPPHSKSLSVLLSMPEQRVDEVTDALALAGLVSNVKGAWLPAREPHELNLADVSAAVGGIARISVRESVSANGPFERVAGVFARADESTIEKLKGISWADLVNAPTLSAKKP
jgi:membrane protein